MGSSANFKACVKKSEITYKSHKAIAQKLRLRHNIEEIHIISPPRINRNSEDAGKKPDSSTTGKNIPLTVGDINKKFKEKPNIIIQTKQKHKRTLSDGCFFEEKTTNLPQIDCQYYDNSIVQDLKRLSRRSRFSKNIRANSMKKFPLKNKR